MSSACATSLFRNIQEMEYINKLFVQNSTTKIAIQMHTKCCLIFINFHTVLDDANYTNLREHGAYHRSFPLEIIHICFTKHTPPHPALIAYMHKTMSQVKCMPHSQQV